MTTRALQIESLLDPVIDPNTGAVASGYSVYFYAAGTSTAKNVWTEKEKTNPFTSKTLGSDGTIQLYGDGIYKIVIKDLDGDTIFSWDNIKIRATNYQVVQKAATYTGTPDDDVILVDTDGGDITINLQTVANFDYPLVIKNIGSNQVTIDPYSSETIDGATTLTLSSNAHVTLYPDTVSTIWRRTVGIVVLEDSDGDTKVQVEEGTDEDIIRFDIGGTEQVIIDDGKIEPTTNNDIDIGSSSKSVKKIYAVGPITTGTLNEYAAGAGVMVDGLWIKDAALQTDNCVASNNITASSVITTKIADSNVTTAKLADNAVTPAKTSHGFIPILNIPPEAFTELTHTGDTNFTTVMHTQIKIPSGPTVLSGSVYIKNSHGGDTTACQLNIGAASSGSASTTNDSYTWSVFASSLDVSGLTPGTVYTLNIKIQTTDGGETAYLDGASLWWE